MTCDDKLPRMTDDVRPLALDDEKQTSEREGLIRVIMQQSRSSFLLTQPSAVAFCLKTPERAVFIRMSKKDMIVKPVRGSRYKEN